MRECHVRYCCKQRWEEHRLECSKRHELIGVIAETLGSTAAARNLVAQKEYNDENATEMLDFAEIEEHSASLQEIAKDKRGFSSVGDKRELVDKNGEPWPQHGILSARLS